MSHEWPHRRAGRGACPTRHDKGANWQSSTDEQRSPRVIPRCSKAAGLSPGAASLRCFAMSAPRAGASSRRHHRAWCWWRRVPVHPRKAAAVLERAVDDVRRRYAGRGETEVFDALKGHLSSDPGGVPYQELSQQLGQSEPAVAAAGRVGPLDGRGHRKRPGSDRLVGRPKRRSHQVSGSAPRGLRPPSASRAPRPLSGARR